VDRELRKTKEFLERVIDSSVDGIIAADIRGTIVVFNKGAERITGYPSEEVIAGRLNVRSLYPPGVALQVMKQIRAEQYGGKGRLEPTRNEIVTKSGERVPVNMTAAIVYDGGRELATVGVFSDLRERTKLEAKLSKAQERIEQAEKQAVVAELAGTAAHELNQPLTSVMGYAEMMKRKLKDSDPFFKPVDIIYREAERMAEIVRKIGKITRYETKAYVGGAKIIDIDKAAGND
jgi:PAS domain S-box-containing protein